MPINRSKRRVVITKRDLDVYRALEKTPLTPEQLLTLSETFGEPFPTLHRTQTWLRHRALAGLLRSWRYATTGRGNGASYYKLTLDSYRIVHGHEAVLPTKRFLKEIAISRQHHTRSLADYIVHTMIAAHRCGIPLVNFYAENTLQITLGEQSLYPDTTFDLLPTSTRRLTYHVELDNSTEPIHSVERLDSWQQKLRLYYQHAAASADRFKLIVVTTKNSSRLPHILKLAATLNPDPTYSLVSGIVLEAYLAESDVLYAPCFRDQRNDRVPLLRSIGSSQPKPLPVVLSQQLAGLC